MITSESKHARKCPICSGHLRDKLFQQRFSILSAGSLMDGYDVVICKDCGFCFADYLPNQSSFDVYYREMSKYEHQDRSGQPSDFETSQFPALAKEIKDHIPNRQSRILEIGCANGGLLNALKQIGYQYVFGIDPSPVCAQNAEQLYQIKVQTNSITDIKMDIGPFDFIILVAVLEHIKDLSEALAKIYDLLSPDGKLYIEVPDAT